MRPAVSVVMPFAGKRDAGLLAAAALLDLDTRPDDELILVDNSGTAPTLEGLTVIPSELTPLISSGTTVSVG